MKRIRYIFLSCIVAIALFSCEEREFIFPDDQAYAEFKTPDNSNSLVLEKSEKTSDVVEISVIVAAHKGDAVTVNFDFSTEGLDNPAIEGTDFELVNTSKTLTFPEKVGVENIQIRLIDNDVFDKNKEIKIVLTSATVNLGLTEGNIEFILRIIDDEDPLSPYKGIWDLSGSGTLVIEAHPSDPNKVLVNELFIYSDLCTNLSVIADVDFVTGTITLPPNAPVAIYGPAFGGGEGKTCVICAREEGTNAWLAEEPIVGQLQNDGSILFSTRTGFTDAGLTGGAWWQGYMHWTKP